MGDNQQTRTEEYLTTQEPLRSNAFLLIMQMLEWSNLYPGGQHLVEEMLHGIFFLGEINRIPYSPEMIFGSDVVMLQNLKQSYPDPFEFYLSQLPKRSPFSCVLDMVVYLAEEWNENLIKHMLQNINRQTQTNTNDLNTKHLISSTACVSVCEEENGEENGKKACVSQKDKKPVRYYGVSMSTSGGDAGQIVIAASCLSYWDNYVADAVMTYYPRQVKKKYFDGTIKLPQVRCKAFSISDGVEMSPCRSCQNLFGLRNYTADRSVPGKWAYGNCAEAESLSNLLKNESGIKEQVRPTSATYTDENRKKAKRHVLNNLRGVLGEIRKRNEKSKRIPAFEWNGMIYPNTQLRL
ncbi:uncharacterized protein LOC113155080 [Anabas testudineus]|uniref:uncharacterized protein LOC113155080 n=1 Tax=Anabas testudineus TaxID=64144 RepID=UPI000E45666B|nr:uncharacterized protein LOC113155080 [Anabas testudineus]